MTRFILSALFLLLSFKSFSAIIYVNVNATGSNDGSSWTNAYTDLQNALSVAFVNDDIWVAKGIYKPTLTTNRSISFVMKNGVDVYGGFAGTETTISERNIASNPTILSGDIGAQGDNTDNTYKIVKIQNFTTPFTLDGFRIVNGYDAGSSGKGAGIYVFNNPGITITINNTIVYNNYAYHSGGGMLIDNSNTTFNNCEFLYNSSYNYGGGAIYSGNVSKSKIYLYDCKFIGNNSRDGVAVKFDGKELVMDRNLISSNTSTESGDIISVSNGPTRFEISNSLIVGNQISDMTSSIISSYTDDVNSSILTNVTICHNKNSASSAPSSEIIEQSNSAMVISNCIIFGNTKSDLNRQINSGNIVRNSIVEGGYSGGTNIHAGNPLFVNPGMLSTAPFDGTNYDYSLQESSPAVNYGDNLYAQNFTLDFLKSTRIQQVIVDCGAIESPFTDTQAPVALCKDTTLSLNNNGFVNLTVAHINNNSSDNVGIAGYTLSQAAFDCTQIGNHSVDLTVTDAVGNASSCTSTVTVVDLTAPMIVTKNISVYLDGTGHVTIAASDVNNGTFDNCELDTFFINTSTFTCANAGTNTIQFTAKDIYGNTSSTNVIVTVVDSVLPIAKGKDVTLYLNANGTAILSAAQVDNGSSDDCGITSMTLSRTTYNCFNIGANPISLNVKDVSNNLATFPVTVTVLDTIKPTTIGKSIVVNLNTANPAIITASQINNGSYDNCTFSQTVAPSSFTAIGTYSVVLTSTDASGNSSSATYTVEVIDELATEEQENVELNVYPNPTNGLIHVKMNVLEEQITLRLLDISGRLIASKQFFNTHDVDFVVKDTPGLYFIEIETKTRVSKRIKIVKI